MAKKKDTVNTDLSFLTEPETPVEPEAVSAGYEKEPLYVGNPSTTPRGFMLRKGQVVLKPYEIRKVPYEQEEEVRKLFKTRAMQAMLDLGLFQLGRSPILQLRAQVTPKAPSNLETNVSVKSTGADAIAGTSTNQIGGTEKMRLDSTVTTHVN